MGAFWPDLPTTRVATLKRVPPPIPASGWQPPRDFPNLSGAAVIGLDTETYDPHLKTRGPGWARNAGHIVGVSVSTHDAAWYFPVRHTVQGEMNLDPANVFAWLRDTLARPSLSVVGANLIYDAGWLTEENVHIAGAMADVQFAEALLTEDSPTTLEAIAEKYLGRGKETPALYSWLASAYGGAITDQRKNIHRAPVSLVGPYAEADAQLPLLALDRMWPMLRAGGFAKLFALENGLIPLLVAMRRAGTSVDIPRAEMVRQEIRRKQDDGLRELRAVVGFEVNVNSPTSVAHVFDSVGLPYRFGASSKPSFTKEFLKTVDHPVVKRIAEIRELDKLRSTFIDSYILGSNVDGKIYTSFHPLRGEDGGARSGRFASALPNLQNIPIRTATGKLIRQIFVHDRADVQWRKYDYSQIEYRMLAHCAVGQGADEIREIFNANPAVDYHQLIMDQIRDITGYILDRKPAKNINFGFIYGMGKKKLSRALGLTPEKADELFDAYHRGAPFAKATMDHCSSIAQETGMISTILGRVSRFDQWEPVRYGAQGENRFTARLELARQQWPGEPLRRALTHKALNRRLQGGAADVIKVAMYKCWKDGLFNVTGVPRLTVHDELDFSDHGGNDAEYAEIARVLETAVPLRVPVRVDCSTGPNWGDCD